MSPLFRRMFSKLGRCSPSFPLATLVLGVSFTSTLSYAQAEQKIIVRCTYDGYNNQTMDFAIDLAARTIYRTHTFKDPNGANVVQNAQPNLTAITDDQITWAFGSSTATLNRYTGQIVEQVRIPGQAAITNTMSCQRQQKQF